MSKHVTKIIAPETARPLYPTLGDIPQGSVFYLAGQTNGTPYALVCAAGSPMPNQKNVVRVGQPGSVLMPWHTEVEIVKSLEIQLSHKTNLVGGPRFECVQLGDIAAGSLFHINGGNETIYRGVFLLVGQSTKNADALSVINIKQLAALQDIPSDASVTLIESVKMKV